MFSKKKKVEEWLTGSVSEMRKILNVYSYNRWKRRNRYSVARNKRGSNERW